MHLPQNRSLRFLSVLSGIYLLFIFLYYGIGVSFQVAQLGVFPFVVLLIAEAPLYAKQSAQSCILVFSSAAIIFAIGGRVSQESDVHGVLVATFLGDEVEADSHALAEKLKREFLSESHGMFAPVQARHISHTPASWADVVSMSREYLDTFLIVWGNPRWIKVFFPKELTMSLAELSGRSLPPSWTTMNFVLTPPVFGMSLSPRAATGIFLSRLGLALSLVKDDTLPVTEESLLFVKDGAALRAFWTAETHRGLLWNVLGVLHVKKALLQPVIDISELYCALEAFQAGAGFVKVSEHPELLAALLGNAALTERLLYELTGRPFRREASQYRFRQVKKLNAFGDPYGFTPTIRRIVLQNKRSLRGVEGKKVQKTKGKKKKRFLQKRAKKGRGRSLH